MPRRNGHQRADQPDERGLPPQLLEVRDVRLHAGNEEEEQHAELDGGLPHVHRAGRGPEQPLPQVGHEQSNNGRPQNDATDDLAWHCWLFEPAHALPKGTAKPSITAIWRKFHKVL